MAKRPTKSSPQNSSLGVSSALSTVAGPADPSPLKAKGLAAANATALAQKFAATEALAEQFPQNAIKGNEYGEAARAPSAGEVGEVEDGAVASSTVTEGNVSDKVGAPAVSGVNAAGGNLERVRSDSTGQHMTTNQGVPVADNQNSLKIGLRGPTALEDFILREKITHFDHERIPERVVHARGSAAHGYFECTRALGEITRAAPFAEVGKTTPVFARFSTVAGERGSADTARDVRGFAVKFYTEEGNWDLVGNNIPVFFIQDAMKFPDLIHAVKPEPHHGMPQAASAHDTFWDFVSLMPESSHMLMWHLSDRAIPRSYRMMQGFGVHTFRLVNEEGVSLFCKFHWNPVAGTHSLIWDEAVKIAGADADFHRRDLWEAIEAGAYPEWELGLQVFSEEQAEAFDFDVLDPTKLVPEELVPVVTVGRMVLNRNPDNFFAETEQVAFCTAHVVPGIDFSNDPLLQGRNHSYLDTQLSRLGGANFHQIPINAPVAQVHNNQRDGHFRQSIPRGRVAYEPNSLAGGCPFQAGMRGFTSFPERVAEDKVRGKPERFADHYSQARLFFASQSPIEQQHIIDAARFELTRVQTPAIRQRVIAMFLNIDERLATEIATGIGLAELPQAMPLAIETPIPEYPASPALSLMHRTGDGSIKTRKVAIFVAEGADGASVNALYTRLGAEGAVPRLVGVRLGAVKADDGQLLPVEVTMETAPGVLWDALFVPAGVAEALSSDAHAREFAAEIFRHYKALAAGGDGVEFLQAAGISGAAASEGVVTMHTWDEAGLDRFIEAIAQHRAFARVLP